MKVSFAKPHWNNPKLGKAIMAGASASMVFGVATLVGIGKTGLDAEKKQLAAEAKNGNIYKFLPSNVDSYGRAALKIYYNNYGGIHQLGTRVDGIKFNQQIGDNVIMATIIADGKYKNEQTGKLDGVPTQALGEKFYGTVTITNNYKNTMEKHHVNVIKGNDGEWNISVGQDEDQKNYVMLIERDNETGKADINVYEGDKLVYKYNTGKKIVTDDVIMKDNEINEREVYASDTFPATLLSAVGLMICGLFTGSCMREDTNQGQEKEQDKEKQKAITASS